MGIKQLLATERKWFFWAVKSIAKEQWLFCYWRRLPFIFYK